MLAQFYLPAQLNVGVHIKVECLAQIQIVTLLRQSLLLEYQTLLKYLLVTRTYVQFFPGGKLNVGETIRMGNSEMEQRIPRQLLRKDIILK